MDFLRTSPRLWFFTLAAGLTLSAVATPALLHFNFVLAAFAIRKFYSVVCHQDPARSWWFWGAPAAICYRCLGIYAGAAAGTWWRAERAMLIRSTMIFAFANAVDVAAEMAGWHGDLPWVRLLLGAMLGSSFAALIAGSFQRRTTT